MENQFDFINKRISIIKNPFLSLFKDSKRTSIIITKQQGNKNDYEAILDCKSITIKKIYSKPLEEVIYNFDNGDLIINKTSRDNAVLNKFENLIYIILNDINKNNVNVLETFNSKKGRNNFGSRI